MNQQENRQRILATLEEQAAGYTVLTIPANLVNEIEAKRQEIARLETWRLLI